MSRLYVFLVFVYKQLSFLLPETDKMLCYSPCTIYISFPSSLLSETGAGPEVRHNSNTEESVLYYISEVIHGFNTPSMVLLDPCTRVLTQILYMTVSLILSYIP